MLAVEVPWQPTTLDCGPLCGQCAWVTSVLRHVMPCDFM